MDCPDCGSHPAGGVCPAMPSNVTPASSGSFFGVAVGGGDWLYEVDDEGVPVGS